MKKAAIIPTISIGDGLLMMIVANHLRLSGYDVTIFHKHMPTLKKWLSHYTFEKEFTTQQLKDFDYVIVQNDNSKRIQELKTLKNYTKLSIFYFTYKESKHGKLFDLDIVLDNTLPIAQGLALSCQKLFNLPNLIKDAGIIIPKGLTHKKHPKRVVIHPTSGNANKNWSKAKFIKLAKSLRSKGYRPTFTLSVNERRSWLYVQEMGFDIPLLPTLSDLANTIYESGYFIGNDSLGGHLASCLNIPNLILASNRKQMKMWQPGWLKANVLFPPSWVPNIKYLRLKEKLWQSFIRVSKVLKEFSYLDSQN